MTLRRAASARAAALLLLSASAAARRPAASASARRVRKASSAVGRIGRPETSGSGGRAGCSAGGSGRARSLMINHEDGGVISTRDAEGLLDHAHLEAVLLEDALLRSYLALGRRVARGCEPGVGSASTPSCCSECTIHWPSCRTCTAVWRHRSSYPCRMSVCLSVWPGLGRVKTTEPIASARGTDRA